MNENELTLMKFYTSLQQKNYTAMGECYHDEATFRDEAFDLKTAREVRAMWEMLCTRGKDMEVTFRDVKADAAKGSGHWEAFYTFSTSGNKVHNVIDSEFTFKDGLILTHVDHFSFYNWSKQSLGTTGLLLGWTGFLQRKVRKTAMNNLAAFMNR